MNYKKHITYDQIGPDYILPIHGTDSFIDLLITLDSKPDKDGNHSGCAKAADFIISEIEDKIDPSRKLLVKGHSMGGSISQNVVVKLSKRGVPCKLDTCEDYAAVNPIYAETIEGLSVELGSDAIPLLFRKKYAFPCKHEHIGPERTWYGTIINIILFPFGKGDHTKKVK